MHCYCFCITIKVSITLINILFLKQSDQSSLSKCQFYLRQLYSRELLYSGWFCGWIFDSEESAWTCKTVCSAFVPLKLEYFSPQWDTTNDLRPHDELLYGEVLPHYDMYSTNGEYLYYRWKPSCLTHSKSPSPGLPGCGPCPWPASPALPSVSRVRIEWIPHRGLGGGRSKWSLLCLS